MLRARRAPSPSQRSLQDAPIFRLLLKVAVKGTHQCDFTNFWGSLGLPTTRVRALALLQEARRAGREGTRADDREDDLVRSLSIAVLAHAKKHGVAMLL